ncbi:hypothetical protein IAT40_002065 [Kwoniella sp. CBS 6097]
MNPTPAKRARRSASPSSPTESTTSQAQRDRDRDRASDRERERERERSSQRPPTASPSHPILPAPIPSGPSFPPFAPGPSGWQSNWRSENRRSFDAGSPSSTSSPKMGEGTEDQGVIFTRDIARAPRSMMACTRCRRQKMKCDGPSSVPCRGCRQSGQPCIFEPRSRPKSISVIPSRPPPFHMSGRPGSPTAGFYPAGPQPAPPVTSRPPPLGTETYAFRQAREPMPPPPPSSLAALASPYHAGRHTPPPIGAVVPIPQSSHGPAGPPPAPMPAAYYNPPPNVIHPPPFPGPAVGPPPVTPSQDSRLRHVESAIRSLSSLPSAISALQASVHSIQRTLSPRRSVDVHETTWDNYRTRAWPLTPWLVGLRDSNGLPGMVVSILGKRTVVERDEHKKKECETLLLDAAKEIGRLVTEGGEWSREEMRAIGVLATWVNDPTYATLAVAQARLIGLDKLFHHRRTHDDWREWIYLIIMDHFCHLPDFIPPVTRENLAGPWRDRLGASPTGDPAVRDRDLKLLAWLEYAEMLADVHQIQQVSRSAVAALTAGQSTTEETAMDDRTIRAMDPWRKFGASWETWAGGWGARNDPILALHHNYAILYTSSPIFMADERIWEDLASGKEGYTQLERGRDAAISVIQAISSVEIGRTLPYSFAIFRPFLALSVLHLISLALTIPPSSTPIITTSQLLGILRQAYDAIISHQPLDRQTPSNATGTSSASQQQQQQGIPICLLGEIVEGGRVEVAKRWVGMEVGRDTWKRIVG